MEHHNEEHVSRKFHHLQTHTACDRTDEIETIKMACLDQIVLINIGNQLVSNRLLNCFTDEGKI